MKKNVHATLKDNGEFVLRYQDSELMQGLGTKVFNLNVLREEETSWTDIKDALIADKFDSDSIQEIKRLLDMLLFENGDQG